jgi:hypothetical protein
LRALGFESKLPSWSFTCFAQKLHLPLIHTDNTDPTNALRNVFTEKLAFLISVISVHQW